MTPKKKRKKAVDKPKRLCSNTRMKNKVTFAQIVASVRKTGGRPSVAFQPKKAKVKQDRHAWKREME
jgi:hypothetical protein